MVWLGFMAYQPLKVIYAQSSLYICIKYVIFVVYYGISNIVG